MASIRFNVKPTGNKKMQIRAMFQDGTKQTAKYTGYNIPDNKLKDGYKFWDSEKQLVKSVYEKASEINALIIKWRSDFETYKDTCKREKKPVDIQVFLKLLAGEEIISSTPTLLSVAKSFVKSIKATHKNTTVNSFNVLLNDIEKYEKNRKKVVMLHQVDKMFYKDFSVYLIEENLNTNATINKKQVKIITILNHAVSDLKINIGYGYKEKYKFKETQAAKFPLRPEELALLRSHTCSTDYQQMVLDAFLLACETGLRFSDIQQLQPAHINSFVTDSEIIQYIDLKNIKGSQTNTMPLSNYANVIIDKYMKSEGYLFEFKYSQSASRCLKDIFADPKLNLNRPCETIKMQGSKIERTIVPLHDIISFHMGRNTYITRLLSSSIAPVHVQGNAGHSDIAITMGYFRNDDINRFRETLKVLNEKKPDVDTSSPS